MGRVVSIKVPVWAIPPGVILNAKDALNGASVQKLAPLFEGLDGAGRIERIRLDQASDDYLARMEVLHNGVPKGRICAGLIAAYYRRPDRERAAPGDGDTITRLTEALGFKTRMSQHQLYSEMRETLRLDKIGFHEASTGTGKQLTIIASALDAAGPSERVVIAVPTIGLVESVDGDLRTLLAAGVALPSWQTVYGRGEFMSRKAAIARLSEDFSDELNNLLAASMENGDWRLSTWQRAAPHITGLSTCVLSDLTPKDDPGLLAYKAQFDRDVANLVVCTHAMLAIDTVLRRMRVSREQDFQEKRRQERAGEDYDYRIENLMRADFEEDKHRHLPEYKVAFIDEAHMLEQAFASVMAVDVSLWQLLRALRSLRGLNSNAVPKAVVDQVDKSFKKLMPESGEDADSRLIGNDAEEAKEFKKVLKALGLVKEALKHCDKDPEAQVFVGRARTSLLAFFSDSKAIAMLSFSPSKRFPRLLMGRNTTHREMNYLWTTMRAGALVSATLNIMTNTGLNSIESIRYLLNVPPARTRALAPIVNPEIYRPVTCYTPNPILARSGWLIRPTGDDDAGYEKWFDELADPIRRLVSNAVGGTLILTTSYRMIEALEERLRDNLNGRLMVSAPGKRLAHLAEDFLDISAGGRRPVWLATGGAWTGLDLSGVRRGFEAKFDNILTDEVITNIPFRTNRSLSHASRTMRGGNFEFVDTYVKFKQALGRLVRNPSPELPANRNLWIMDGRLHDLKWRGKLAAFNNLLKPYRQQNFA